MLIQTIISLVEKIQQGAPLEQAEALRLASLSHEELPALFWGADSLRRHFFGNRVYNCSIVNARCGACSEDCVFCAQSVHHHAGVEGFPLLDEGAILTAAVEATAHPVARFGIVTSGKGLGDQEIAALCATIRRLKREELSLHWCASLGILDDRQLAQLKEAGLTRFHHNLETSRRHFPSICTTHSYQERVDMVRRARAAGFEVCSGALFGLGEDWEDRVAVAFALRELDVVSVPLNFLAPIPGTPAAAFAPLSPLEVLHTIALFRFCLPDRVIKVCGGREHNLRDLQAMAFTAGANGMLVGNYLVTSGQDAARDQRMLRDLELESAP